MILRWSPKFWHCPYFSIFCAQSCPQVDWRHVCLPLYGHAFPKMEENVYFALCTSLWLPTPCNSTRTYTPRNYLSLKSFQSCWTIGNSGDDDICFVFIQWVEDLYLPQIWHESKLSLGMLPDSFPVSPGSGCSVLRLWDMWYPNMVAIANSNYFSIDW